MINIIKKYLQKNNYVKERADFEELYQSHPNYPSFYAVTATFDLLSIPSIAVKVPKEQFEALPAQFVTFYNKEFALVSKSSLSISVETERKKQKIKVNDFLNEWDGIVIAIEPKTLNSVEVKKIELEWFKYAVPFLALILISLLQNIYSSESFFFVLTTITGLLLSIFIIQEELGVKNETVAKLCNMNASTSCSTVIKSGQSKVSKWMNFADLPLIFFGITFLAILFMPLQAGKLIGLLSLLSVPVIIYSVWLQKFQLKKWCVLCLAVGMVIVLQGLTSLAVFDFSSDFTFSGIHFQCYMFLAVLFISVWLYFKPILKEKIKAGRLVNELKKFRRNYNVFNFLSQKIPHLDGFDQLKGVEFGNRKAEMQLTLVLSPSCGHCHKAFQDAYELVREFPERTFLKVLFNLNPENNDNPYRIVVESLLTINSSDPQKAKEAIIDWHMHKLELEAWKDKWLVNVVDMKASHQIQEQYNWCLVNEFNYTPIKIINNNQFPTEYDIPELKFFINDFSANREIVADAVLMQA